MEDEFAHVQKQFEFAKLQGESSYSSVLAIKPRTLKSEEPIVVDLVSSSDEEKEEEKKKKVVPRLRAEEIQSFWTTCCDGHSVMLKAKMWLDLQMDVC